MRNEHPTRSLLGITQLELAMLLRVNRSQLAMFDVGKRDLPLAPKLLLAELLAYLQAPELSSKSLPQMAQQNEKLQQRLCAMLKENEYRQLSVAREKEAAEKRYAKQLKALHVFDFFTQHPLNKGNQDSALLKSITKKTTNLMEAEGITLVVELELKLEALALEKLMLQARLRKLGFGS